MDKTPSLLLLGFIGRLSRLHKQTVFLLVDVLLAPLCLVATYAMALPSRVTMASLADGAGGFVAVLICTAIGSLFLGIPRIKLKAYEAIAAFKTGVLAVIAGAGLAVAGSVTGLVLPLATVFLFVLMFLISMVLLRFAMLYLFLAVLRSGRIRHNVVIYGAGGTGSMLAAALRSHESIRVVAFVDDNASLHGMTVLGHKVRPVEQLDTVVARHDVQRVLLAMPSAPAARQAAIIRDLLSRGLDVQSVPSFGQIVGSEVLLDSLSPVTPGAFLGRDPVNDLRLETGEAYTGKRIMVSGAGGSVGSELCRRLLTYKPSRIVLFDVSEIALYTIERELKASHAAQGIEIIPVLGTVTEARQVRAVLAEHAFDVILHAAAYKHVPLVEANPIAGLVNNVLGTRTLAEAALQEKVKRFILISTDKAVRPTNVMGATKRMAEFVVQDMARRSTCTDFSIVRFGNVLGSSGSVVPLFREQIARGGPVTLTHEDVTRYFMTLSEAASLVLIAGGLSSARGPHEGDLFVLDMGPPIKIRDLAERMIRNAGYSVKTPYTPKGDIEVVVIGLRPGEKLHEELLIEPGMLITPHPKILRAQERSLGGVEMVSALREVRNAVAIGDADAACAVLEAYVEGYVRHTLATARASQTAG